MSIHEDVNKVVEQAKATKKESTLGRNFYNDFCKKYGEDKWDTLMGLLNAGRSKELKAKIGMTSIEIDKAMTLFHQNAFDESATRKTEASLSSLSKDLIEFKKYLVSSHRNHPGLTKQKLDAIDTVIALVLELDN